MSDPENSKLPDPADFLDPVESNQTPDELPETGGSEIESTPEPSGGQGKRGRRKKLKDVEDSTDATDVLTRPLPTSTSPVTVALPKEKPEVASVTITNRTQQVLSVEIRGADGKLHGVQILARKSIIWPKQEDYGADVNIKLRRKLISILPIK